MRARADIQSNTVLSPVNQKMSRLCNVRLRTVLLVAGLASCLLAFSSVRCMLFNVSCTSDSLDTSLSPLKYNTNNEDVHQFLQDLPEVASNQSASSSTPGEYTSYSEALKYQANKEGVIILVSTDLGYIRMALNLYYTSFKKLNITNYLYVCSDADAAHVLKSKGIAYYLMKQDKDGKTVSAYGSAAFIRKTHIKTSIIYGALKLNYKVLITDVDIVFLKNPFPYFLCTDCDIEIQSDGGEGNSGFYFVKPTKAGKQLHAMALDYATKYPQLSNQKAIAKAMGNIKIKSKTLDVNLFPHGKKYYEDGHRMFPGDNPCKECVIVHDNWIVSGDAKEYRFKENLMWLVDLDQYYSNPNAKYIIYDNPIDFGPKETISNEIHALKCALSIAYLLKRILILPDFHCYSCGYDACKAPRCTLNTHLRITTFNQAFNNSYREHTFLQHPLVPDSVKASISAPILIQTAVVMSKLSPSQLGEVKHKFHPSDQSIGANSTEILQWMEPFSNYHVLRFHSMYKAFSRFETVHSNKAFMAALSSGLKPANYRQY